MTQNYLEFLAREEMRAKRYGKLTMGELFDTLDRWHDTLAGIEHLIEEHLAGRASRTDISILQEIHRRADAVLPRS